MNSSRTIYDVVMILAAQSSMFIRNSYSNAYGANIAGTNSLFPQD